MAPLGPKHLMLLFHEYTLSDMDVWWMSNQPANGSTLDLYLKLCAAWPAWKKGRVRVA